MALAAGLVVATAGQLGGGDTPGWVWWLFTPLLVAGVLLRRWWPLLAVCVATAGFVGQHVELGPTPLPIDLAVPLAFYTLASVERPRRAVVLVSLALIGVITALGAMHVLLNTRSEVVEVREEMLPEEEQAKFPKQFAHVGWPADAEVPPPKIDPPPDPGDLLSAALGQWVSAMLVLGLAFAIGDGVRSRRAHLRTLEKRAADLEREQHQRVALAMAAERARITRELHDVVAHGLSVMVVQAQGGRAALRRHPDNTADALDNIITTGRTSLAEMRRLLTLVRRNPADDPQLVPVPGVAALPELIDRVRGSGTPVAFAVEGEPVPLTIGVDLTAYRVVQEALTNTIAHAGQGASATVFLRYGPGELVIDVSDDGACGAPRPSPREGEGNGLRGIAERVGLLHGEFAAGPSPAGGFKVSVRLPLKDR